MPWIKGFDVRTKSIVNNSYLLYADDILILCGADRTQMLYLNQTFLIFASLPGLHINMSKNVINPVNEVQKSGGIGRDFGL